MDSKDSEVTHDFHPFFRIYKDGRIERFVGTQFVPPSDSSNGIARSKDVKISSNVSARIFIPQTIKPDQKLALLIYVHGGAFTVESAFSSLYNTYLTNLTAEANVIILAVDYRLAPEHPIPACYDDTWETILWAAQHSDPWLNTHADFTRVYLAGDSAGANIVHNMIIKFSNEGPPMQSNFNFKIMGMVLVHPYFGNKDPAKLWDFICPDSAGLDDPRLNPAANQSLLEKMDGVKVLVCTAEKDFLRDRGWDYYESLKNSKWGGVVDIVETHGEEHVFHLFQPEHEKAWDLINLVASFLNNNEFKIGKSLKMNPLNPFAHLSTNPSSL